MSSLHTTARNVCYSYRLVALVLFLLFSAAAMPAQCPSNDFDTDLLPKAPVVKPADEEPLLPEAGFLSDSHYTSQFFGFGFDLPLTVKGHQIMLPVMPEKQHALLALQFENAGRTGYMSVIAIDPRPGFDISTPEREAQQLKNWARYGGETGTPPKFFIPDYMLRSGRFYYTVRHKGKNYAAQYWTSINNYAVKVVVATNDQEFLRKAKTAMAAARFYCPQDDGTLLTHDGKPFTPDGEPYEGPTVPTYRVDGALRDQPGKKIPLGGISGGIYRDPDIGLQYELPKGWEVLPAEDNSDPPRDDTAQREYDFLHACSQTLLRMAPHSAGDAKAEGPTPMIVLRAMDPNCLSLRTATSLRDKRIVDEVAANFEELGAFGEIATDELVSISDHMFMVFHGTIAAPAATDDLAKRMSQSIFAVRHDKLLLVWSLLAPTTAALNEIPTSGISFDGSAPIQLRTTLSAKK